MLRLAADLDLRCGDRLLLLGGGLGGPACAIAQASGAWIVSAEADPTLAQAARQRVASHANGALVSVEGWDPARPALGVGVLDRALSLEALRGADPEPVLDSLAACLRPQGQIVITELVTDRDSPGRDREFAAWCRLEHRLPALPRAETITSALTHLRYDVRVVEDVSTPHVEAALAGWRRTMRVVGRGAQPARGAAAMVSMEAELWLLRIRMMRRFGLRLVRWHAVARS